MNYPHQTTTDPNAFTLWPDASVEELAVWAQATGYAQQTNNFSFDDLDTAVAWGQSAALPATMYDFQNNFNTGWPTGGMGPVGDILGVGASLAGATATDNLASAPATSPFPTDTLPVGSLTQGFFGEYDFSNSLSSTPSLTDVSSAPSPQSDGTGNGFIPFPAFEGVSSHFVQPSGPSSSQHQIAGVSQFPSWLMGDVNLVDWPALDLMATNSNITHPMQSDCTRGNVHIAGPTEALSMMVTSETVPSSSSLGKRRRNSEGNNSDGNGSGLQKKSRPSTSRVMGGAESTKRARRSPVTRTRTRISDKSKAAGHGAGRLASKTARGVYHRSSLGHSVSQGSMGTLVPGQPSWIEEREVEVQQDTGSAAPQQIVIPSAAGNAEDGNLHPIPPKLTARQRLMLQTTQADEERGAVSIIKCKLCPSARLSTWEVFKRHCRKCEKHPTEVKFCPQCGDYFARPDSKKRHYEDKNQKIYKEACRNTSPEEAREKKQKVELLLRKFEASLDHHLRNGGKIKPFSEVMNKKLANTSKKESKQDTTESEDDSWAA